MNIDKRFQEAAQTAADLLERHYVPNPYPRMSVERVIRVLRMAANNDVYAFEQATIDYDSPDERLPAVAGKHGDVRR